MTRLHQPQPALPGLEQQSGWTCWVGWDGHCYARRPTTPSGRHDARGDTPAALRQAILLARTPGDGTQAEPGSPSPAARAPLP